MSKQKTETLKLDLQVEDVLSNDKSKQVIKSLLKVPYSDFEKDKALRVFNNSEEVHYASTRLNTLFTTSEGYETDVTGKNLFGKKYELVEVGSRLLLAEGKIQSKKAEAKVIEFPKTGTKD